MNIFFLHNDPVIAAQMQCDRHIVKMTIESAQMLSTAHRMLDGIEHFELNATGRRIRRWYLEDARENVMYKAVHMNHPCTIWTRQNSANYLWHYEHFVALCDEYTYRYGNKTHKTDSLLRRPLTQLPDNIIQGDKITPPAMAIEESCKFEKNPVECYRRFYETKQARFSMHWTKRKAPDWFHFYNEEYIL